MRSSTRRDPSAKPSRPRVVTPGTGPVDRKERRQWRSAVHKASPPQQRLALSSGAQEISLREDRREVVCSLIGLSVKLGLVVMAGVSLFRLAGAYQERMERQGELSAVLEIEKAQLAKARNRFDQLFMVEGEQKLIREQSQWIAPNRMRVVWQTSEPHLEKPVLAMQPLPSDPPRP